MMDFFSGLDPGLMIVVSAIFVIFIIFILRGRIMGGFVFLAFVCVLFTVQTYLRRATRARFRSASDDIGDRYSPGNTNIIREKYGEQIEAEKEVISNLMKEGVIDQELHDKAVEN